MPTEKNKKMHYAEIFGNEAITEHMSSDCSEEFKNKFEIESGLQINYSLLAV